MLQDEIKYKKQLDENQKYFEKINQFKEKMSKKIDKDIFDELPCLDLENKNQSTNNEDNDDTLSYKSEENEQDDREKFITYFETLKRKLPDYQSNTSSIITISNSQTSLSSLDSDLYIIEDKVNPVEKAIIAAKNYVLNNASFDKNNNISANISCLKRDHQIEEEIINTEYVYLKN